MKLEDIKPGLMVHARGDGSMGGAPGEHVGSVIGVEGEYLRVRQEHVSASPEGVQPGREVWIPLAWVSWTDQSTIHLSKTLNEFRTGAQEHSPASLGQASQRQA